eukprot:4469898-Amphidinium_carterae.1
MVYLACSHRTAPIVATPEHVQCLHCIVAPCAFLRTQRERFALGDCKCVSGCGKQLTKLASLPRSLTDTNQSIAICVWAGSEWWELQNDKGIALIAVHQSGQALEFVSDELRGEPLAATINLGSVPLLEMWGQTFSKLWCCLQAQKAYCLIPGATVYTLSVPILRGDREVVLAAVSGYGHALEYAAEALKWDDTFAPYLPLREFVHTPCQSICQVESLLHSAEDEGGRHHTATCSDGPGSLAGTLQSSTSRQSWVWTLKRELHLGWVVARQGTLMSCRTTYMDAVSSSYPCCLANRVFTLLQQGACKCLHAFSPPTFEPWES